jgi:RepB DNA-primase from phage plasmid
MTDHIVERVWRPQPGSWRFLSTKEIDGRWEDHPFRECDVAEFVADHRGSNIYFCPHGFSRPQRIKAYAVPPRLAYADLDSVDPRHIELEPSIAIESSPRRYVGLWLTDAVMPEHLNKRLTYALGADKGNWKLTQVLRVPGSINHKPEYDKPRVRLMWDDGPRYKVSDLERRLPMVPHVTTGRPGQRVASRLSMRKIIARHELSRKLVDDLLGPGRWRNIDGQRGYKVHWRMAKELNEAGVPRDEAFVLLSETAWNKHTTDDSVWAMIDKIWRDGDDD